MSDIFLCYFAQNSFLQGKLQLDDYQTSVLSIKELIFLKCIFVWMCVPWGRKGVGDFVNCAFPLLKCNMTSGLTFCKESWQSTF